MLIKVVVAVLGLGLVSKLAKGLLRIGLTLAIVGVSYGVYIGAIQLPF